MLEQKEQLYDIFTTMALGKACKNQILQYCIVLVGLTRVGKSTVHCWLSDKKLIGSKVYGKTVYVNVDKDGAPISCSPLSKTLIPNINYLSSSLCIIDTAGFKDKRNYVGVFSVSYLLKMIFEGGFNFKFIIVVSLDQINTSGSNLLDSIFHFINLFDFEKLDQQIQKQLLASVAMIIVRAESVSEDEQTLIILEGLYNQFKNPAYRYQKKDICLKVYKKILDSMRVGFFRKAVINRQPEKQEYLNLWEKKRGWNFINLKQARKLCSDKLIKNNFQTEYELLTAEDQDNYIKQIQKKISFYLQISKILVQLKNLLLQNILVGKIDYSKIFEQIRLFLAENDNYIGINKQINHRVEYTGIKFSNYQQDAQVASFSLMKRINLFMDFQDQLFKLCSNIREYDKSQQVQMLQLKQLYKKILSLIKEIACSTKEEEQTIINLSYILLLGFQDLYQISQIDQVNCSSVHIELRDRFASISPDQTKTQIIFGIMQKIFSKSKQERQKLFSKQQLFSLHKFCENIFQKNKQSGNLFKLIRPRMLNTLDILDLLMNQGCYQQAINLSVNMLKSMLQVKQKFENEQIYLNQYTKLFDQIEDFFYLLIKQIGKCLFNLKQYVLAIRSFSEIQDVHSVCKIYRYQIEELFCDEDKKKILIDFATYCSQHGRGNDAFIILQEYIAISNSRNERINAKKLIFKFQQDRQTRQKHYRSTITFQKSIFEKQTRKRIASLLQQIPVKNISEEVKK